MGRSRRFVLWSLRFLLGFTLSLCGGVRAQEPGAELTISLITIDPGSSAYELFGHNGIRIRDPRNGTDLLYHWGNFDFDEPGFYGRFLRGYLIYEMGENRIEDIVYTYQHYNRSVHEQMLNLTPAQRKALHEYVLWNIRPENKKYRYDYYWDNCSTRVRDAIDRAMGGVLRSTLDRIQTQSTDRTETQRLTYKQPPLYTGLMLAMGPNIDERLTAWDEGFIPMKLRDHVRSIGLSGPAGATMPFVISEHTLFQAQRDTAPATTPFVLPWYIAAGLLLGGVLVVLGSLPSRRGKLGFAILAGLWSLLVGSAGTIILLLWAFTEHTVTYRNENILQANTLSLLLLVALIAAWLGKAWGRRASALFALVVAGLASIGFAIQLLPEIDQANGEVIALLLPAHVAIAWVVGRERVRHRRAGAGADARASVRFP
jgi:hypothetical protein